MNIEMLLAGSLGLRTISIMDSLRTVGYIQALSTFVSHHHFHSHCSVDLTLHCRFAIISRLLTVSFARTTNTYMGYLE